jgi:tetratricopeptide (TPR) repeat protein
MAALYGPTPVAEAIARCEDTLAVTAGNRKLEAFVKLLMSPLHAMSGDFDTGRELYTEARGSFEEIGATLLEQGLRFSALHLSTVTLYKAEAYLEKALRLAPDLMKAKSTLAEVYFLLGKYEKAAALWRELLPGVEEKTLAELNARLERIEKGEVPRVPAVDYLEAIACSMSLREEGAFQEAAAILNDVMADAWFALEFPMAEIPYLLALCCLDMGGAGDARVYLRQALRLNPDFSEAKSLLEKLQQ